jgi:hypothetical protein
MAGNLARFDADGISVGNGQLIASGGDITIGKNLFVGGDIIMSGGAVRGVTMDTYTVIADRPPQRLDILFAQSATYYTDATVYSMTVNFLLGGQLPVNNAIYYTILLTNSALAYPISTATIDNGSTNVTMRWAGGSAPTGSALAIDYYSFQILRTASGYTIFAATTKF